MRAFVLVALLLAPAVAWAGAGGCAPGPLATARDLVQDDAGSGGDAADCRAGAYVLPVGQEYSWGFLDPAGAPGAGDLDDWFAQDLTLAFGSGSYVMVNVSSVFPPVHPSPLPQTSVSHLPYALEAYAPGATSPTARVTSCGGGVWLPPVPGTWHFRVTQLGPLEAEPCTGPYLPGSPPASPLLADYGVYRGCNPLCFTA